MIKETTNTNNSLEELSNKNDFEFINSLENNIDEIHQKIQEQKNKRKQVIGILKVLNIQNDNTSNISSSLSNISEIITLVNSNINSLYTIEIDLNNICRDFTNSYVPNAFNNASDSIFDSIKSNIDNYSTELSNLDTALEQNNQKIDNYLQENANLINTTISDVFSNKDINSTNEANDNISLNSELYLDNPYLVVSEKEKKVFLPYKVSEINSYLEKYPKSYSNFEDVVKKEFILSLDYYTKRPVYTRFRETYSLIRDREGKSILEALKYSFDLMFKDDLNPCIIAACKTQNQLDDYLVCLDHNNLDAFEHFKIQFLVNPL